MQPLCRRAVLTNTVHVLPMQLEGFVQISCTRIAVQSHAIHVAMKYAKTWIAIVRIGSVTVTTMNTWYRAASLLVAYALKRYANLKLNDCTMKRNSGLWICLEFCIAQSEVQFKEHSIDEHTNPIRFREYPLMFNKKLFHQCSANKI